MTLPLEFPLIQSTELLGSISFRRQSRSSFESEGHFCFFAQIGQCIEDGVLDREKVKLVSRSKISRPCKGELGPLTPKPITETPPVSLRLPSGSLRTPQTGARDSAMLDACSSHQRMCSARRGCYSL